MRNCLIATGFLLLAGPAFAHDGNHTDTDRHAAQDATGSPADLTEASDVDLWTWLIDLAVNPAVAATNVSIAIEGEERVIRSNGLPDHATGRFPNSGNPHTIQPQSYVFRVAANPRQTGRVIELDRQPFGVALNGIPFDPGTAEYWNNDRTSEWRYEALSGKIRLGLDDNNAHVQPNGAYHYHGLPTALMSRLGGVGRPVLLGYAADGFPIYGPYGYRDAANPASGIAELRSSYRLRTGQRPGGPGGTYDGAFTADYAYVRGAGDLDECNGRTGVTPEYPSGTYYYVVTSAYPFISRCFKGIPNHSFARNRGNGPPQGRGTGPRNDDRRGPPPRRQGILRW